MTPGPAARLAGLIVLAAGIATATLASTTSRALLVAILAGVLLVTRPSPRWLALRLAPVLLGLGALLVPLLVGGGGARAPEILARALGAALVAISIASTIPLAELGSALATLGVPRSLASTVHTLLWQLEHVGGLGRRLILARQLRGARRFGPEVLAQLLVRTTGRAERVDLAMRLRGALGAERARFGLDGLVVTALALALALALHVSDWSAR